MTSAIDQATDGGTILSTATYLYDPMGNRLEQDKWTSSTGLVVTRFGYDSALKAARDRPHSLGDGHSQSLD